MRILVASAICLYTSLIAISCADREYRQLRNHNRDLWCYEDSILIVNRTVKIRDKRDSLRFNGYMFNFYETPSGLGLNYIGPDMNYNVRIIEDRVRIDFIDTLGNFQTLVYPTASGNLEKGKLRTPYVDLSILPVKTLGFFNKKTYRNPKIKRCNDTIIFIQRIKGYDRVRNIYALSNGFIFRVEEIAFDSMSPDIYERMDYHFETLANWDDFVKLAKVGVFMVPKAKRKETNTYNLPNRYSCTPLLNKDTTVCVDIHNKYLLLDFWYLSCPPCHRMIPVLEEVHKYIDQAKIQIIGVNPIDDSTDIANFLLRKQISISQDITPYFLERYPVEAYPTLLLIDNKGIVIRRIEGYNENIAAEIRKALLEFNLTSE